MMMAEKDGFVLVIDKGWCEIENEYGVLELKEIIIPSNAPENYAEMILEKFISEHSIQEDKTSDDCVKAVIYDKEKYEYIQLQGIKKKGEKYFTLQYYDSCLVYMKEEETNCERFYEVREFIKNSFKMVSGLSAEVYRWGLGDCTNDGISANRDKLYILSEQEFPFHPDDIRECVTIEKRIICNEEYVDVNPVYCSKRWYMAGGNFLYTNDGRYREITGISYPVPIYDRYEGEF